MLPKIFTIIIIFFTFSIFSGCDEGKIIPQAINENLNIENFPNHISWNIEVIFVDSSYTKAILKAKRARIYDKIGMTLLDSGLQVEFMSKQSKKRISLLIADSAEIEDKTKNMIARGNVVVTSDSSFSKLETTSLQWNNTTQKIYSTDFVKITTPTETIQGWGFESDQYLINYKIFRVSGVKK